MSVRTGAAGLLGLAAAAAWASCIYDKDERCSPGEELNAAGYCECPAGSVPVYNEIFVTDGKPDGNLMRLSCKTCGAHEVVAEEKCVCDDGFTRESDASPCVVETAPQVNFGTACTDDSACTGPGATCILDDTIGFTAMETRGGTAPHATAPRTRTVRSPRVTAATRAIQSTAAWLGRSVARSSRGKVTAATAA
jgi:hypothetical protein